MRATDFPSLFCQIGKSYPTGIQKPAENTPLLTILNQGVSMIRSNTKVTFQKSKALFNKCVGTYLHADGEPRAQIWWLTGNHVESQALIGGRGGRGGESALRQSILCFCLRPAATERQMCSP
jgi:hypothetical protein